MGSHGGRLKEVLRRDDPNSLPAPHRAVPHVSGCQAPGLAGKGNGEKRLVIGVCMALGKRERAYRNPIGFDMVQKRFHAGRAEMERRTRQHLAVLCGADLVRTVRSAH